MHDYDTKSLQIRFGIPPSTVRSLVRAGHIKPRRRAGRLVFSFQDLVVLRTVRALRAAKIPAIKINRTLRTLRSTFPSGQPLSRHSLTTQGTRIVVRDGHAVWEPDTGQYALAFHPHTDHPTAALEPVAVVSRASDAAAETIFAQALALDNADPSAAADLYRKCLHIQPLHGGARLNLGRLLHLAGALTDAETVYTGAFVTDAALAFNLALLYEAMQREVDALLTYREVVALDPRFADAHFHLARLQERAGNLQESFKHLIAHRRLTATRRPVSPARNS